MSFTYQPPDIVTDVTTLKGNVVNYLENYMPGGWRLAPGSLIDLIIEAVAIQAAQQADVVVSQLVSQFRYLGSLFQIPPIDAIPPSATATFTVQDTVGYSVPAGSTVAIPDGNGVLQGFDSLIDLVIAPGASTGTVTVVAETAGTAANGLSGSAQLLGCPPFVTGASLSTAVGGVDAETDPVYLQRLTETTGILRLIPVLGADFATLARSVAGVFRACGVNQLKPGPPYDGAAEATGQDKNVTVAVTDINGASVGSTVRAAVQTYLQSLREANFKIWVVDAQHVAIDVAASVFSWPGWDTTVVDAAVTAAVTAVLSPAVFATDPSGNAARWSNDPVVRASVLYRTIMEVPGVRYVTPSSLLFGIHGGTQALTDYTMGASSSIPALPIPTTINITVTATTS